MTGLVKVAVVGLSLFYMPILSTPTDWLYNAPRTLLGLAGAASASASATATPASYIADLRRRRQKVEELRSDKELTEQEDLVEDTQDPDGSSANGEVEHEGNNEAAPSLLEKKVGKILAKLRLLAQIKNAYHYNPEMHEHESNITFNITSVNHNQTKTNDRIPGESIDDRDLEAKPASIKIQPDTLQPQKSYGAPHLETGPLKVQLDVNQINNKLQEFNPSKNEQLKEHEPGKFGTVGVFFAELLGSIVGLTYGALAQLASGGQNPVTVSASEGL